MDRIPALNPTVLPPSKMNLKVVSTCILLFIGVLGGVFFRSPISQISSVQYYGNVFTHTNHLEKQSGLQQGDSFFWTNPHQVEQKLTKINCIKRAVVKKKFPGIVMVYIEEYPPVVYELVEGSLKAVLANGESVELTDAFIPVERPVLTQWNKENRFKKQLIQILMRIPTILTANISEIIPDPTLAYPDRIRMYTRLGRFQVTTAISLLSKKIQYLNGIMDSDLKEPGVITMLEADSYEPYTAKNNTIISN